MKKYLLFIVLTAFLLIVKGTVSFGGKTTNSNSKKISNLYSIKSDTTRINYLVREARKYTSDFATIDTARVILEEAEKLTNKLKLEPSIDLLLARYEYYITLRDFSKSTDFSDLLSLRLRKLDNKQALCQFNDLTARACFYTGTFKECIEIYEMNINLAREEKIKGIIPQSHEGLYSLYIVLRRYEEAKSQLDQMIISATEENDFPKIHKTNLLMGQFFQYQRMYPEALKHFMIFFNNTSKVQDTLKMILSIRAIGWNYYLQNQMDSALHWYNKMLYYSQLVNNPNQIANAYCNIGTIFTDQKEYKKAEKNLYLSIEYAQHAKDWYELSGAYHIMSNLYKANNDFKKAYQYHVLYNQYNDSVRKYSDIMDLTDSKKKFQVQTREIEMNKLAIKVKTQKYFIYSFSGILFFVLLTGFLLFRQWRLSSQRRLSEMNRKISEITQANLRQQMNPHFIFNTLNSIQYYMYQNDKLSTNDYLTKFSSLMRKILENSQHTAISMNDELNAVQLYLELESIRFKNKFDYEITIDEEIDTLLYKIPTMLIQPYVENAICHGLMNLEKKGHITINIKLKPDHLLCMIVDNGIGREASMEINQTKEISHRSLGTKITESRIDLINMLYGTHLKTIYTDLKDENGLAAGTMVEIQIPIIT